MIVLYDIPLVALSVLVAIVGSLTALAIATLASAPNRLDKIFAIGNGAIVMGTSIWSMHFIGMMAVQFPVLVNYNFVETALSLALATGVTGLAFFVVSAGARSWTKIAAAGLFMGLSVAGMHYLGMAAIAGCGVSYEWRGVALSILIAVAASTIALWFTFHRRGLAASLLGGIVMGLAIASMHYTAMLATYFTPLKEAVFLSEPLFSQGHLAYMIASFTVFICVINLMILAMVRARRASRAG